MHVFNHLGLVGDWPQIAQDANLASFRGNLSICYEKSGAKKTSELAIVWWFIWFTRNRIIFSNDFYSVRKVSSLVLNFAND